MKIQKVTITEKELCKAVEAYLATQGVSLPVASVEKDYSYSSCYTVEFVEEPRVPAALPAASQDGVRLGPKVPASTGLASNPNQSKSMKKLNPQKLVDDWNAKHPVGTAVTRYKFIEPLREPEETKTRSTAWVMGGHTAMVMVEGVTGGVALESVKPR